MPALHEVLVQVRERIERYRNSLPINEQNTKAALIDPVLRALGWDIEDVEEVHREYKLKNADNPVDYALLVLRTPRLFIEAKPLGDNLDDRRWASQIMGYASVAGVEWVVLTNGDEYRLYNSHATVPVDEKLFRTVHVHNDTASVAETLGLLSKGEMEQNALDALWQTYFVDREVRRGLESLFAPAPDPSIIRLIAKRLPKLSPGEIRAGLSRMRLQIEFPSLERRDTPANLPHIARRPPRERLPSSDGVSLQAIIQAGIIEAPFEITKKYKGHVLTAIVDASGQITFGGEACTALSRAASVARQTIIGKYLATNGWDFWRFRDSDGHLKPVDALRQRYLKQSHDTGSEN